MIKIALTDDDPMVSIGLGMVLDRYPDITLVGQAVDQPSLFQLLQHTSVDILLLDINFGTDESAGLEMLPYIRGHFPALKVILFSIHNRGGFLTEAKEKGADGYLIKGSNPAPLAEAIREVGQGNQYFDPSFEVEKPVKGKGVAPTDHNGFFMTPTEKEVILFISRGFQTADIARTRDVAEDTIEKHRKNSLRKAKDCLDIHTMAGLVGYVERNGLL